MPRKKLDPTPLHILLQQELCDQTLHTAHSARQVLAGLTSAVNQTYPLAVAPVVKKKAQVRRSRTAATAPVVIGAKVDGSAGVYDPEAPAS